MAIVVIGGLLVSTLLTLLVVPVFYAIVSRSGERAKTEKLRKQFIFMDLNVDTPTDAPAKQTEDPIIIDE